MGVFFYFACLRGCHQGCVYAEHKSALLLGRGNHANRQQDVGINTLLTSGDHKRDI